MKFRLPKRRIWRVAIYIVSTLLVLLAIDLIAVQVGRHISPGHDTTRITEPTLPDGRVDYLAALENHFGEGVTNENNAAPLVLEALGPKALPSNQPRDGITARLGMPPLPEKGDYFQTRDAMRQSPETPGGEDLDDVDLLMEHPWNAADHPRAAAWIAMNEKPLAKLIEASKRTRYFMPFNGGTRPENLASVLLPHLASWREACRALVARAMLKAGKNDIAGAREDLMASERLADLLGQGSTLIDRLVGYAVSNVAATAEVSLAADQKVDAAQAAQWLTELKTLAPVAGFADAVDYGERYMFLDMIQLSAAKGFGTFSSFGIGGTANNPILGTKILWPFVPMRYGGAMRAGNAWYDQFVAAAEKPAGPERLAAMAIMQKDFDAFLAGTRPWHVLTSADWPIAMFMPALFKIAERTDAAQAKRNLAVAAMTLAARQADRASYAPLLKAIKSTTLPVVPSEFLPAK